jgi:hypothetical protein
MAKATQQAAKRVIQTMEAPGMGSGGPEAVTLA